MSKLSVRNASKIIDTKPRIISVRDRKSKPLFHIVERYAGFDDHDYLKPVTGCNVVLGDFFNPDELGVDVINGNVMSLNQYPHQYPTTLTEAHENIDAAKAKDELCNHCGISYHFKAAALGNWVWIQDEKAQKKWQDEIERIDREVNKMWQHVGDFCVDGIRELLEDLAAAGEHLPINEAMLHFADWLWIDHKGLETS